MFTFRQSHCSRRVDCLPFRKLSVALAVAALSGQALAFDIPLDDPDLKLRWDNTLRYNLGIRAEKQDAAILANSSYDESDAKFKRGNIVMNRLDLLTEADLVFKGRSGLRVSAAAWADQAYNNTEVKTGPGLQGTGSYPGDQYTSGTKRWYRGPSGEVLDAFAFVGFDAGTMPVNIRLGQHTVYWGESLFSFVHGVSYSQGPIDVRLASATPGISAKELFKPVPQLSGTVQLNEQLSVAAQYIFRWKGSTLPYGGTYFGALDAISSGGTYLINPAVAAALGAAGPAPYAASLGDPEKRGDWGIMARWTPDLLKGGTAGFYFRKYTDSLPQLVSAGFQAAPNAPGGVIPTAFGLSYRPGSQRATLVGASLSGSVSGVSVAGEIAHRSNGGLLMGGGTTFGTEPVGDTWHALANAIAYFGSNPLWDAAALTTEVAYSRLDKVKKNAGNFNSFDHASFGCSAGTLGCATKDAWSIAAKFEPTWYQPLPGVDLSMPVIYTRGISGTSPVLFGGYEGSGTYSLGLNATVKEKYILTLAYNDSFAKHKVAGGVVTEIGGIGAQWDRGWVSLTVKADF